MNSSPTHSRTPNLVHGMLLKGVASGLVEGMCKRLGNATKLRRTSVVLLLPFAPFSWVMLALVGVLLISMIAPLTARAADQSQRIENPPDPADNAALQYWRAFAMLPPWDDALTKALENPAATALDPEPIQANLPSLHLLRLGAQKRYCNWGIDYTVDGPGTLMPYLSTSRQLVKIACLRARIDASKNHPEAWEANLHASLRFARDVGDGPLICRMVQSSLESLVYNSAAPDVPTMDSAVLGQLASSIDGLSSRPLSECIVHEKEFFGGWIIPKLKALQVLIGKDPAKAKELRVQLKHDMGWGDDDDPELDPTDTPAKIDALIEQVNAVSPILDRMGQALDLPLDQSLAAIDTIDKEKNVWPPLARVYMPSARAVRLSFGLSQTRGAMFRAGLAVVLEGKESLAKHLDPSTGQAFSYKALGEHAFELGSAAKLGATPVVMTFGRVVKTP